MASLIGYLVWRVAAGLMAELSDSVADDAQWGTLEQVWLSGLPAAILFARSGVLILYYTVRSLIMGAIILLVLRIPLTFTLADMPGAVLIYLLTLVSPFGLALVLSGLHLAFKNVNAITQPLATVLLFLTGAVVPLTGLPVLYLVSRFLPLSIGVELLRDLLVENVAFTSILVSWSFVALLINSGLYLGAGLLTLHWARQKALDDGSLAHY
jgi:ABC-2 type transport system permease protein